MDVSKLNELLECSVCLNTLDISSKVLPCQHTFCKNCLKEIVESHKELRCPECRVLVTIPVDDLPPNVLLTRILEGMKNAANQATSATNNASPSHETASKVKQEPPTTESTPVSVPENVGGGNVKMKHPHAKAIYDFNSKESGDLNFKKSDIILLKKKIDQNWYIGELNSRTGSFPINHVQIIVPLPVAQCKSLYDFKMKPNEEEGCLTFKKGTVINVLRRVDQNWAEGRIDDAIGIFPISFVEMNAVAKQLMEVSAKNMQLSSSTSSHPMTTSSSSSAATNVRTVPIPPFETTFNNSTNASDSSTTTSTSPHSTPSNTSSSNSSTAPNSPINSQDTENLVVTVQARPITTREKRNSLTALISTGNGGNIASHASNRHSAEILSVPELENVQPGTGNQKSETVRRPERTHHRSKSGHHNPQQTHIQPYVALYPYKPQKPDELELKKGSVYYVLDKCQDGWFKGVNRQQKSGVFPGNYVAPIRTRATDNSSGNSHSSNQKGQPIFISRDNYQKTLQPPPDLPPRNNAQQSTGSSLSNWSKTLHMDSLFSRKSNENSLTQDPSPNVSLNSSNESQNRSATKEKKDSTAMSFVKRLTKRSKSPSTSTGAYSMDNPVFEDSSVSGPTTSAGGAKNIHLSHPVHVRSGSCPSQLLQNIPMDVINQANQGSGPFVYGSQRIKGHKERPSMAHLRTNVDLTISAANNRLRNAQTSNQSSMMSVSATQAATPSSVVTANNPSSNHHHRKSQSLDASSLIGPVANENKANRGASAVQSSSNGGNHTRERYRCIVPYPPNSEYELELRVGDIVFVTKKRENGWFKGQHQRSGRIGLFPSSFVQPDI
ncbi:E3 ubiquitin-protein ligase SH3RF1 [Culicoides brevitarsis]|uniref:E3 ubiquitin-protein ligase SH3RF1 n=1 Tax=Culicoides brevitarsis TaxID=469753 RepID=UPI00307CA80C